MLGKVTHIATKAEVQIKVALQYKINYQLRRAVRQITKKLVKEGGNEFDVAICFMIAQINALSISAETKAFVREKTSLMIALMSSSTLSEELDYYNAIHSIREMHTVGNEIENELINMETNRNTISTDHTVLWDTVAHLIRQGLIESGFSDKDIIEKLSINHLAFIWGLSDGIVFQKIQHEPERTLTNKHILIKSFGETYGSKLFECYIEEQDESMISMALFGASEMIHSMKNEVYPEIPKVFDKEWEEKIDKIISDKNVLKLDEYKDKLNLNNPEYLCNLIDFQSAIVPIEAEDILELIDSEDVLESNQLDEGVEKLKEEEETSPKSHHIDKRFYLIAYEEIENAQLDKGTWAMALVESLGDKVTTESSYIKLRSKELKIESVKKELENQNEIHLREKLLKQKIIEEELERKKILEQKINESRILEEKRIEEELNRKKIIEEESSKINRNFYIFALILLLSPLFLIPLVSFFF